MNWESCISVPSSTWVGVEFVISRMSFTRRMDLMRRIRDLAKRHEYFQAGQDDQAQMEASLAAGEIDRVYLQWGLVDVSGLCIDGEPASAEVLIERGPEDLVREALTLIRTECGLDDQERKN